MVAGWQKYSLYQRGSLLDERVETLVCTGIAGTCGLAGEIYEVRDYTILRHP